MTRASVCLTNSWLTRLICGALVSGACAVACGEGKGGSDEPNLRAQEAYLDCMEEFGINVGDVHISEADMRVFIEKGNYTEAEAEEANGICIERVKPIIAGDDVEGVCEHELSPGSMVAGSLGVAFDEYDPEVCTPDEAAWVNTVSPVVEERCGTCHGNEPGFGAPLSLTDYDALLEGAPGARGVDRIAIRTASHTMPPPASTQLDHAELDLLVEWATCGEVHPDPTIGLVSDKALYSVDAPENLELPSFELLANDFALESDTLDRYQCFGFDVPIDEARLLQRIQVSLDESRVLHHILVAHDPDRISDGEESFHCEDWPLEETPILWAWGPGGGAFDFDDGGFRLEPTDRVVVQIHYNNGAGLEDVRDNTGVRIFHGPTGGREWSMLTTGAYDFEVPEGPSIACGDTGPITEELRVLAAFPHMHRLGAEMHTQINRADGSSEDLINLTGWNFEAQRFYDTPSNLHPGDSVHTWCGSRNESGAATTSGSFTDEEMCFNFLYVSPD